MFFSACCWAEMVNIWWREVIKELLKCGEHLICHFSMLFLHVTVVYDRWDLHMTKSNQNDIYLIFVNKNKNLNLIFYIFKDFCWLDCQLDQLSYFILTTIDGTMNFNSDIDTFYVYNLCIVYVNYNFNSLVLCKVGAQWKCILTTKFAIICSLDIDICVFVWYILG